MDYLNTEEFVNAVGALCEVVALLRYELMKNGCTRKEAVQMCGDYMIQMLIGGQKNGSNKV